MFWQKKFVKKKISKKKSLQKNFCQKEYFAKKISPEKKIQEKKKNFVNIFIQYRILPTFFFNERNLRQKKIWLKTNFPEIFIKKKNY